MVSGAVQGVKKICALVREAKEAGHEVADLMGQVTGGVSKVLEHSHELKQAEVEARRNPPKGKSLSVLAFEEVSRKLQLKQQYADLRTMIIYELGLPGGFWDDFEATLRRLEQEQEAEIAAAEQAHREAEWRRRARKGKVQGVLLELVGGLLAVAYLVLLAWAVRMHHQNRLPVWLDSLS